MANITEAEIREVVNLVLNNSAHCRFGTFFDYSFLISKTT